MAEKQPIIIIKKGGGAHAGHHGGAWKVAFADFMTAMMAFFLVMWLMGSDEETKSSVADYFNNPGSGSSIPVNMSPGQHAKFDPFPNQSPTGGQVMNLPAGKMFTNESLDPELSVLKERLQDSISLDLGVTSTSEEVQMIYDSEGLVLRIAAKNFFPHNDYMINPDLKPLLHAVGKVLASDNRIVRIVGHADQTEGQVGAPLDPWMLSAARAKSVVDYWQSTLNFDPKNLEVAGDSHYRQVAASDSSEGRAANRRIEIIVPTNRFQKRPANGAPHP